ncbi:hypothetical protein CPB85DRAFT_1338413 [Mucidula mucida]|nr:hypothetical protein CPB85DRAFT_1338413 [Mucidula mucida]
MSTIFNFLPSISWSWGPHSEPLDETHAPPPPAESHPPPLTGVERIIALNNAMRPLCASGRVHRQLAELIYSDPMFTGLSPRCTLRHAIYVVLMNEYSCPSTRRRDPPPKRYLPGQEPVFSHPSAPRPDGPKLPPAQFNTSEYFAPVYPIPLPEEARLRCSVPYGPVDPEHAPPSMSRAERQSLIDEFLYEHSLRKDLKRRRDRDDSGDSDEGDGDDDGHKSRRRRFDYTLR